MNKKIILYGLYAALGELVYILLVALLMQNAEKWFGNTVPSVFGAALFLSLFVLSAAVSGALILGKPILMYLEGSKKQALHLFGVTLGWIGIFVIVTLIVLIF